jgi:four helix bundle protein
MASSYRDLKVWQSAIDLAEMVYVVTANFPPSEIYGLTSQLRRASVSIPSNIAEGWGRHSRKDYGRFVLMARGSNDELQTQLILSTRLKFGDPALISEAARLSEEVGRMLNGLHIYLQTPRKPSSPQPNTSPSPGT